MKKLLVGLTALSGLTVFVLSTPIGAQLPTIDWSVQAGGTAADDVQDVAVDSAGNIVAVGRVDSVGVDFDPGAGTHNLGAGLKNWFVWKLDPAGNLIWAHSFPLDANTGGMFVGIGPSDSVVLTGEFLGTVDFDPGAGTFNLAAGTGTSQDGYILLLDSAGNFVDAKQITTATNSDIIQMEKGTVDAAGNIYLTGQLTGTADFDPGAGTVNVSVGFTGHSPFAAKYDATGALLWARVPTTATHNQSPAHQLVVDSNGDVIVTGQLQGTLDFDPGAGVANLTATDSRDGFLWKLDANGDFVWAGQTQDAFGGKSVAVDSADNVYMAGRIDAANVDIDPNLGTQHLVSTNGGIDIYISKVDSAGNFVAAVSLGSTTTDDIFRLAFDSSDALYALGIIFATADMDPGGGVTNLVPAVNTFAGFLLKLDSGLGFDDVGEIAGNDVKGLATDGTDVIVGGRYQTGMDLDPGPALLAGTSNGGNDAFVTKLLGPVLTITIAEEIPGAEDEEVDVAVDLTTAGEMVAGIAFEVDFDETCLSFDDTGAGIPDDIDVNAANVTGDFTVTATFDGGDTDGELDITISDINPPVATLSDGTLLTITFTADQCSPALGSFTIAPVTFPDPTVSFSDPAALDLTGENEDGSVEVWPAPRGDCNSSGVVSVADLIADGLEIFDSDGTFWADTQDDGFAGSPVGCDANADTTVNAGDISCTVLLIFGGTCGGGAGPTLGKAAWGRPQVWINGNQRVSKGDVVYVPVHMRSRGNGLSGLAFSLDIDSSRFGHAERVPLGDLVTYPSGRPMLADVRYDRSDRNGEIDVVLGEDIGRTFGDGVVLQIPLRALRDGRLADGIRFADRPGVSFGNSAGQAVRGFSTVHGGKR